MANGAVKWDTFKSHDQSKLMDPAERLLDGVSKETYSEEPPRKSFLMGEKITSLIYPFHYLMSWLANLPVISSALQIRHGLTKLILDGEWVGTMFTNVLYAFFFSAALKSKLTCMYSIYLCCVCETECWRRWLRQCSRVRRCVWCGGVPGTLQTLLRSHAKTLPCFPSNCFRRWVIQVDFVYTGQILIVCRQ